MQIRKNFVTYWVRWSRLLAVFGVLAMGTGCMKTTVALEPVPGAVNIKHADKRMKSHFFLFGLINRAEFDLDTICPQGPHWAVKQANFEDVLLTVLTIGIYSPKSNFFGCKGGAGVRALGPVREHK